MENKKDIGAIFKEKINHLDKSPNDNGWNAIATELDKKKKRRVVPFWFFSVGIFSVGILVSWLLFTNESTKNDFLNWNKNASDTEKTTTNPQKNTTENATNNSDTEKLLSNPDDISKEDKEKKVTNNLVKTDSFSKSNINSVKVSDNKVKSNKQNFQSVKTKIALSNSEKNKNLERQNKSKYTKSKYVNKKYLDAKKESTSTNNTKTVSDNSFANTTISSENAVNSLSQKEKSITTKDLKKEIETENVTRKDSLKKKKITTPITKKDTVSTIVEKNKSYTVFVYGSPTTKLFTSNKSALDDRLNSNSKKSEITLSYGAYLCFQGTEKFSIRLGVGNHNSKITTENVFINTFNYSNIDYQNGYANATIFNQSNNAAFMKIIQDVSYTEVPLEFKYKILDKKIGLNAIVGVNYLFLNKNEVSINTENGLRVRIGKTANLFQQTIGANIGIGLDYKLSKKVKVNLEPMLKYQLKNNQNNNSNPFTLNILTGLEFDIFGKK